MSPHIRRHHSMLVLGLTAVVMLSACSGRRITTVVEDQIFLPGPPPAPAVEATQVVPPPPAPPEAPTETTKAEPPPAAIPEPQSAEPPITPAPGEEPRIEPPPASPPAAPRLEEVTVAEQPLAPAPSEKPPLPPSQPVAELSDIFFDFDQFAIRGEARSELEANAGRLKSGPRQQILIEGHCDERGTSAYNLVLGERRAQAVKQYLQDLGVAPSEIQITSYGKERPFCTEHSEACWQSNRRAHFSKR